MKSPALLSNPTVGIADDRLKSAQTLIGSASDVQLQDRLDEELLEEFRQHADSRCFEILVRRYERELYAFLRRFLGDVQRAEDAFQATFITVHQHLHQFEAGRRFRPWLYAIATNKAIDMKRQLKRRSLASLDATGHDANGEAYSYLASQVISREPDPMAVAIDREVSEEVRSMLAKLNEPTQVLIDMAFYQGMKYSEISQALNIPIGTVKSRVFNAMRRLSEFFKQRMADKLASNNSSNYL
jgi:RNA polymerase sigma-70 factor, ECF subfamily